MIVIADTGPINYLILIGEIWVLPELYTRVAVPRSVCEELGRPQAPESVREWIVQPPSWLEIRSPLKSADAELAELDAGERDAILLTEELGADQIIIDEIRGRRVAQRRGLPFIGTLGVLAEGAKRGVLDLRIVVDRLRQTSFHVSPEVLERLLRGN
jgi:predicted nucleic acid-binding protein